MGFSPTRRSKPALSTVEGVPRARSVAKKQEGRDDDRGLAS